MKKKDDISYTSLLKRLIKKYNEGRKLISKGDHSFSDEEIVNLFPAAYDSKAFFIAEFPLDVSFDEFEDQEDPDDSETCLDELRSRIENGELYLRSKLVCALMYFLGAKQDAVAPEIILSWIDELESLLLDLLREGETIRRVEYVQLQFYKIVYFLFLKDPDHSPRVCVNKTLALCRQFVEESGNSHESMLLLIDALRYQALFFQYEELKNPALSSMKEAEQICSDLIDSGDYRFKDKLAIIYWESAGIFSEIGDKDRVRHCFLEALNLWKSIVFRDSSITEKLFNVQKLLLLEDKDNGNIADALLRMDEAFQYIDDLYEENPQKNFRAIHSIYAIKLELLEKNSQYDEMIRSLDEIFLLFKRYDADVFGSDSIIVEKCFFLEWFYRLRASAARNLNCIQEAKEYYYRSIQSFESLPSGLYSDTLMGRLLIAILEILDLLYEEDQHEEAIDILNVAMKFTQKRIAADKESKIFFPMHQNLQYQYSKFLQETGQYDESYKLINSEIKRLEDLVEEGHLEFQLLYAILLIRRASEYINYEMDPNQAVRDFAKGQYYLESYILDEKRFELIDEYLGAAFHAMNILSEMKKHDEIQKFVMAVKPVIDFILDQGRFEYLQSLHNFYSKIIQIISVEDLDKGILLCDEFISKLLQYEKPYSPEKSLLNSLKEDFFYDSLRRVSSSDLEDVIPTIPKNWSSAQKELQDHYKVVADDLLKAKQHIYERFRQAIVRFEILRFSLKQDPLRIKPVVAGIEKIVQNYIEQNSQGCFAANKSILYFIQSYGDLKSIFVSKKEVSQKYKIWFDCAASQIENGYRSDVLTVLHLCLVNLLKFKEESDAEMESSFNRILSYALMGYRLDDREAGIVFIKLAYKKAVWERSIGKVRKACKTLKSTFGVLKVLRHDDNDEIKSLFRDIFYMLGDLYSPSDPQKALKYFQLVLQEIKFVNDLDWDPENIVSLGKICDICGMNMEQMSFSLKAMKFYYNTIQYFEEILDQFFVEEILKMELDFSLRILKIQYSLGKTKYSRRAFSLLKRVLHRIRSLPYLYICCDNSDFFCSYFKSVFFWILRDLRLNSVQGLYKLFFLFFDDFQDSENPLVIRDLLDIMILRVHYFIFRNDLDQALGVCKKTEKFFQNHESDQLDIGYKRIRIDLNSIWIRVYLERHENEKGYQLYLEHRDQYLKWLNEEDQELKNNGTSSDDLLSSSITFSINGANCLMRENRWEDAKKIHLFLLDSYCDILVENKNWFILGLIYSNHIQNQYYLGEYEDVIQRAEDALMYFRKDPFFHTSQVSIASMQVYQWRARAYWKMNEIEKALADLDDAIEYWEKNARSEYDYMIQQHAEFLCVKGEILKEIGRDQESRQILEKARDLLTPLLEKGQFQQKKMLDNITRLLEL